MPHSLRVLAHDSGCLVSCTALHTSLQTSSSLLFNRESIYKLLPACFNNRGAKMPPHFIVSLTEKTLYKITQIHILFILCTYLDSVQTHETMRSTYL